MSAARQPDALDAALAEFTRGEGLAPPPPVQVAVPLDATTRATRLDTTVTDSLLEVVGLRAPAPQTPEKPVQVAPAMSAEELAEHERIVAEKTAAANLEHAREESRRKRLAHIEAQLAELAAEQVKHAAAEREARQLEKARKKLAKKLAR